MGDPGYQLIRTDPFDVSIIDRTKDVYGIQRPTSTAHVLSPRQLRRLNNVLRPEVDDVLCDEQIPHRGCWCVPHTASNTPHIYSSI